MKLNKILFSIIIAVLMVFSLAACAEKNNRTDNVFANVNNDDIPDIFEKTVSTTGNVYYNFFGKSNKNDYSAVLTVEFNNTSTEDYNELMGHYSADATGQDEEGFLLFDWGRLLVTPENDSISITINALIA